MEVYLDILIIENLIMNYLILYATSLFLKSKHNIPRYLVGASIGVLYTVLSLVFMSSAKTSLVVLGKASLSMLIVAIAFNPKRLGEFIKTLITFYVVTFIFAGSAFALIMLGGMGGVTKEGFMYLNWDFPVNYIVPTAAIGMFLFGRFIRYIRERSRASDCFVSLYIAIDGNGVWVPALVDTGNELRDPISGYPVVIVEAKAVSSLIPEKIRELLSKQGLGLGHVDSSLLESGWISRFRIVPYRSIGCENGMLPGFKPDYIEIDDKGQEKKDVKDVIVCLYDKQLSEDNKYSALLAPELVA